MKVLLLPMLLCSYSNSGAQTKKEDKIDQEYHQCLLKDTSYSNISACSFAAYDKWDKELNNTYKKLLGKQRKKQDKAAVTAAQNAWVAYRTAEFNSYNLMFGMTGSAWSTMRQRSRIDLVRDRTLQLRSYIETIDAAR